MKEEVATFGCSQSLVGILTNPPLTPLPKPSVGIIILGAGLTHRVGPSRVNVQIARALGQLGYTNLRFDFSGVGDSSVRKDNLPYQKSVTLETQEAMDFVHSAKGIQDFILLGVCTGSTNSLKVARSDPRVRGLILINSLLGFNRSAGAELDDYVGRRKNIQVMRRDKIFNPRDWWRALTGQINYKSIIGILSLRARDFLFGQKRFMPNTERFLASLYQLAQKGVEVQFVISGGDLQVKDSFSRLLKDEFSNRQFDGKVLAEVIQDPDYTFASLASQTQLFQIIQNFLLKYSGGENPRGQIRIKETPSKLVGI